MSAPHDPDPSDPGLAAAARRLKDLPVEKPEGSLSTRVVEQVRPVAVRRRRVMLLLMVAALAAAAVWILVLWGTMAEVPP